MPRFNDLDSWLSWQETLHPKQIDLGLERVRTVYRALGAAPPAPLVVSVAGTNGKGSSVAMLEAVCRAQGYQTGSYTSPHLLRYNERIRVNGLEQSDRVICDAFQRIDTARRDTSLSYFEFGTLAALDIFQRNSLDIAFLEVGLGGRLDAVNIIDADVALVTAIGLDHTEWLGDNRESIGQEKAGIFRPGKVAVCADPSPPQTLHAAAQAIEANWLGLGDQFHLYAHQKDWDWVAGDVCLTGLPLPALPGTHQLENAAGVLMALQCLSGALPVGREAIETGLRTVSLGGRIQRIAGEVERWLDVSHNQKAGEVLAEVLRDQPAAGRTLAILGLMADKDCSTYVSALKGRVDTWLVPRLSTPRARPAAQLVKCIEQVTGSGRALACGTMAAARQRVLEDARPGDRVLVCGSFHTVSEWLQLERSGREEGVW